MSNPLTISENRPFYVCLGVKNRFLDLTRQELIVQRNV